MELEDAAFEILLRKKLRVLAAQMDGHPAIGIGSVSWPHMEWVELHEFNTTGPVSVFFPTVFPPGKEDPTNPGRRHAITPTEEFKPLQKYVFSRSITNTQSLVTQGG